MKYYKAIVKLGHMGRKRYAEAVIYLQAENIIKAMKSAQNFPGVKHSKIPELFEISKQEYTKGREAEEYSNMMKSIELKTM